MHTATLLAPQHQASITGEMSRQPTKTATATQLAQPQHRPTTGETPTAHTIAQIQVHLSGASNNSI